MSNQKSELRKRLENTPLSEELKESLTGVKVEVDMDETDIVDMGASDPDLVKHNRAVAEIAKNTPEVRFKDFHKFNDDEIKIIAAGLKSRTAIYRIADALQCSRNKVMRAVNENPVLKELALERIEREKDETEEAIDDCIKARVPAVIMWKAAKIMPEKYGEAVNIDEEDDTRIQIGAFSDDDVASAEMMVSSAEGTVPDVPTPALLQAQDEAQKAMANPLANAVGAELAAGGAGVPAVPLSQVPPPPAVKPSSGDGQFAQFVPGHKLNQVPSQQEDFGPDNFGAFSGDDFGGDSWI